MRRGKVQKGAKRRALAATICVTIVIIILTILTDFTLYAKCDFIQCSHKCGIWNRVVFETRQEVNLKKEKPWAECWAELNFASVEMSAEFKLTLTALFSDKFKLVEIRIDAKRLVFRKIQIWDKDNMVKVNLGRSCKNMFCYFCSCFNFWIWIDAKSLVSRDNFKLVKTERNQMLNFENCFNVSCNSWRLPLEIKQLNSDWSQPFVQKQIQIVFYRTQVSLGSDLWVRFSVTNWVWDLVET